MPQGLRFRKETRLEVNFGVQVRVETLRVDEMTLGECEAGEHLW